MFGGTLVESFRYFQILLTTLSSSHHVSAAITLPSLLVRVWRYFVQTDITVPFLINFVVVVAWLELALIENCFKCLAAGHIIIRGWCENLDTFKNAAEFPTDRKKFGRAFRTKLKQQANNAMNFREDNKLALCFEVDDTGCGTNFKCLKPN